MTDNDNDGWHLDKRVPVALILALAGTVASGAWFMSDMNARLADVQDAVQRNSDDIGDLDLRLDRQTIIAEGLLSEISNTNRNLDRLQDEVSETNRLLRDWLSARP